MLPSNRAGPKTPRQLFITDFICDPPGCRAFGCLLSGTSTVRCLGTIPIISRRFGDGAMDAPASSEGPRFIDPQTRRLGCPSRVMDQF